MFASALQELVVGSTIFISVAILVLAYRLFKKYKKTNGVSFLFWSAGLAIFAVATLLETLFALGVYTALLIDIYLFLVVVLVQFLSFGSIELVKTKKYRDIYYAFSVIVGALTLLSICLTSQGYLMQNFVVAGLPNVWVLVTSSIAVFAASGVIVVTAAKSYLAKHSWRMLSIIAGVIIVASAGSAYIVQYPWLLYPSEFIGMVLLWAGFS